jgi:hypothetical protein
MKQSSYFSYTGYLLGIIALIFCGSSIIIAKDALSDSVWKNSW